MTRLERLDSRIDQFLANPHPAVASSIRVGHRWELSLNHGTSMKAGLATIDGRWAVLNIPLAGTRGGELTAWEMARVNGAWPGAGKLAARLEQPGADWVADWPVNASGHGAEGEQLNGLAELIAEAELAARWAREDAGSHLLGTTPTATKVVDTNGKRTGKDLREVLIACGEGRWPLFDRDGGIGIELDSPGGSYTQAVAAIAGSGVEIRVDLADGIVTSPVCREALGRFLLALSARVRMVRGGVRINAAQPERAAVGLRAYFPTWPSASQLDQALGALSVATRIGGAADVQALMDPGFARMFLNRVESWACGQAA